ncbi:MAG: hypothetical protein P4L92_22910 [Rudaea sp.]|nr:hypothetical protein [Rudaea sp.]
MKRSYQRFSYGLTLIIAAVLIMWDCVGAVSADNTELPVYSAPFAPLGACEVPYTLAPGQTKTLGCNFLLPNGLDPYRVAVLANVASGNVNVAEWTILSGRLGPVTPIATVFVDFGVHNNSTMPISGTAHVTAAIAQTTTPAVAAAGVE